MICAVSWDVMSMKLLQGQPSFCVKVCGHAWRHGGLTLQELPVSAMLRAGPTSQSLCMAAAEAGEVPASINRYLREYQREGIRFLYRLYSLDQGGILADDMGLGKKPFAHVCVLCTHQQRAACRVC